ncbi:MAG TPA: hypothetical protein VGS05_04475 [Candidatus Sulfotelmatobacter sp.]|nr:hypothetical protein [Candidatus Sulfotelmatobacter sp.]
MTNPISRVQPAEVQQASHPPVPKPEPQAQTPKSGALSHDQVTLKSAGQPDHDSDRE